MLASFVILFCTAAYLGVVLLEYRLHRTRRSTAIAKGMAFTVVGLGLFAVTLPSGPSSHAIRQAEAGLVVPGALPMSAIPASEPENAMTFTATRGGVALRLAWAAEHGGACVITAGTKRLERASWTDCRREIAIELALHSGS